MCLLCCADVLTQSTARLRTRARRATKRATAWSSVMLTWTITQSTARASQRILLKQSSTLSEQALSPGRTSQLMVVQSSRRTEIKTEAGDIRLIILTAKHRSNWVAGRHHDLRHLHMRQFNHGETWPPLSGHTAKRSRSWTRSDKAEHPCTFRA